MDYIDKKFQEANNILLFGKKRFYLKNLYEPIDRIRFNKGNLWDKIQDKKKLIAFFNKMVQAEKKGGNNDFSFEWIKRTDFIEGKLAFEKFFAGDFSDVDSKLLPFIKACEFEELSVNMG